MSLNKIALLSAVSVLALSACSTTQDAAMPGTSDTVNVTYEYNLVAIVLSVHILTML